MANDIAESIFQLSRSLNKTEKEEKHKNFIAQLYQNTYVLEINQRFTDDDANNHLGIMIFYKMDDRLYVKLYSGCVFNMDTKPDRLICISNHREVLAQLGSWFSIPMSEYGHTFVMSLSQVLYQNRKDGKFIQKCMKSFHLAEYSEHTPIVNMVWDAVILLKNMVIVETL